MKFNAEIVRVLFVKDIEEKLYIEVQIPGQSVGPGTFLGAKDLAPEFEIGDMITIETEERS